MKHLAPFFLLLVAALPACAEAQDGTDRHPMERHPHDLPHLLFQVTDALTGRKEIRYRVNFHEPVGAKR